MPSSFEVRETDIEANIEDYVDDVFSKLETGFMTLPKGAGFVEYPTFEAGYEALKRKTAGFANLSPERIADLVFRCPITLVVLRATLGFTPSEWVEVTTTKTNIDMSQGAPRA